MNAAFLLSFLALSLEPAGPSTLVFPPYGHCMGIYRAGADQLALLLGGLVRFDDPQGLACVKLAAWDSPGAADDDELAVYGVNSGTGHVIFNATMYTLGLYGGEGRRSTELMRPHGIAADADGRVFVADTGNSRVACLRRSGGRLTPESFITEGLVEPWGVALGASGDIWVTDRAAGRLNRFDSPADTLPEVVTLMRPRGVAVYGGGRWDYYDDDFQAVVCGDGMNLVKIVDGEIVAQVKAGENGTSFFNYPVIDYYGNIWVSDSVSCRIHKYDSDLQYLDSFGGPGTGDTEFDHPTGLAVWRRYGQFFIAESAGARYFWVGTDVLDPVLDAGPHGFTFTADLTEPAQVTAQIVDSSGEVVRTVFNGRHYERGLTVEWDGTDTLDRPVPGGAYTVRIVFEPTYSSRGYFQKTFEEEIQVSGPAVVETQPEGRH